MKTRNLVLNSDNNYVKRLPFFVNSLCVKRLKKTSHNVNQQIYRYIYIYIYTTI